MMRSKQVSASAFSLCVVLASSLNSSEPSAAGFPTANCRPGFGAAGPRLCITPAQNATTYPRAASICRDMRGYVATYEDFFYLYTHTPGVAAFNANGKWMGNFVDDDRVLCGNKDVTSTTDPDINNFEGVCSKWQVRPFHCAHDRE